MQTGDVKKAGLYLRDFKQTYSEAGLAQSKLWPVGTLCITIAANIAETSILDIEACFPDSVIGFISEPEKADARFVKYLFDAALKMRFQSFTQGAAQDNLSQAKLLSIKFQVPELVVQKEIADILSANDDLIENNRRRIALLEEGARLLYREWFVHFRFPGHEHVKIINGLPEGWMMQSVGDLAEIKGGKQLWSTLIRAVGPVPVYGGNGVQGYTDNRIYDGFVIVFGRVGANCGSVHWSYDGAWINNNASGLVPHEHPELLLHHMLNCNFANYRKGAAQPFIPNGVLSTIRFSAPHENLASLFCEYARTIRLQQVTLNQQNQKLVQARDLLLTRLMSGEIAI